MKIIDKKGGNRFGGKKKENGSKWQFIPYLSVQLGISVQLLSAS